MPASLSLDDRGWPGSYGPQTTEAEGRWARRLHRLGTGRLLRVAVVLAALVLVCVQTPLVSAVDDLRVGAALGLSLGHAGCLALAQWRPRLAAALSVTAASLLMVFSARGGADGLWPWGVLPLITQSLVLAVVCLAGGWPPAVAGYLASIAVPGALAVAGMRGDDLGAPVSDLMLFASIAGTVLVLTVALHSRVVVGAALAREQQISAEEQAQRRLVEERARIARELHDVVAHTMSLISVQARSAVYRLDDVSTVAAAEFEDIADRAKDALNQMRGVLAVLRTEGDDGPRTPQPGLGEIPALVDTVRAAGLDVTLVWDVPDGLVVAPVTGLSAHRIVQEALSNVMRHAPELPAEVVVGLRDGVLDVCVENLLLASPGQASDGGHGLVGMSERAVAAGGWLECGPTSEGAFRVQARLPVTLPTGPWLQRATDR